MWTLLTTICTISSFVQAYAYQNTSSHSFAGSNSYYLHALLPSDQASYINSLHIAGAKVLRLWRMSRGRPFL